MAKRKPYLLILFFLIFIVSACTNSSDTGAGGDIPVKEAQGEKIAKSQGEAEFLDGTFDFSMMAYLKDFNFGLLAGIPAEDLYPASMVSNWGGEFTIAPDGSMSGSGKLITQHLHQSIGDQIEMGIELSAKSPDGNIEYEIAVSPEAVPLSE